MYIEGPEFSILFHSGDGMAARRAQVRRAAEAVDQLSENDVLSRSDDDLIAAIQAQLSVHVPTLRRDDISFERKMRTINRRDMWGEDVTVEVPVFYFDVPYDGEDVIFSMTPTSYSSNPPRGEARGGVLRTSVVGEEDAAKVQQELNSTLDRVEQYLASHRQMWSGLESEVANAARGQLAQRRQRLNSLGQAEAGLAGFGFKPKAT
ncbi:MAG: hypothetical protein WCY15_01625 [Phenylobacterium sp.]|uniref:hypothetical protein n=1 Tax=Phenylobacterium sp. TaxID=1871053 RepID=UPI003561D880